ncbi:MAG: hypothetical protein M0R80_01290 [Proteobacteria bacterium]|jgi:hypothetical protein|nr:hypothetical protein [Pseudomonadota bacterium]
MKVKEFTAALHQFAEVMRDVQCNGFEDDKWTEPLASESFDAVFIPLGDSVEAMLLVVE